MFPFDCKFYCVYIAQDMNSSLQNLILGQVFLVGVFPTRKVTFRSAPTIH